MNYRKLASWIVGVSLAGALGSVDCGGDDTAAPGGTAGTGGSATGGSGGTGGSATGGSGGTGGTAGTGGTGGTAGSGGTAGGGGTGGAKDAGVDGKADASDAPVVAFSAVTAIFEMKCAACHGASDAAVAPRIDLITPTGRYARLTTPLPNGQEGRCGFPAVDAADLDASGDAGDSGPLANRQAIVPGDVANSFLYTKVIGTQMPATNPPAGCGQRMPRKNLIGDDGGITGSQGCDVADGGAAANCLTQAELDTIRQWIEAGAPNN